MALDTGHLKAPQLAPARTACAWRGLTVEQWARAAEVSTRYLWRILNGESRPSAEILGRLRAALGEEAWSYAVGASDRLPHDQQRAAA